MRSTGFKVCIASRLKVCIASRAGKDAYTTPLWGAPRPGTHGTYPRDLRDPRRLPGLPGNYQDLSRFLSNLLVII